MLFRSQEPMRLEVRDEALYIMVYAIAFMAVAVWAGGPLRIAVGLPMALFLPGYSMVSAAFPGKQPLDGWGRIALGFAFQLIVVPLVGWGLNYSPLGLGFYPILFANSMLVLTFSAVAHYRRLSTPKEKRFVLTVSIPRQAWPERGVNEKALTILAAGSALIAVGAFALAFFNPLNRETFTEFYLLGPDGRAGSYVRELALGQSVTATVGVVSREQDAVVYQVGVRANDAVYGDRMVMPALEPGESWESEFQYTPIGPGTYKLEFLLYREGQAEPYRLTHLFLVVGR